MQIKHSILLAVAVLTITTTATHADFSLIDNMESGNNWSYANSTAPGVAARGIVADPADSGNSVFSITASTVIEKSDAYLNLGTGIADGTTGTLFFQVRAGGSSLDWVFGASDVAAPNDWADYEGYGRLSDVDVPLSMDIRDGSGFTSLTGTPSADTWYNVWLVLNNTADTTTMYYTTGSANATTPIASATGAFRNGTSSALTNLFVRNNADNQIAYIDNIYLDTTGTNLVNPIPEPSSLALIFGCLATFVVVRRRN